MVVKANPHVGGRLEVRLGGPAGRVLGSMDIPLEASKEYFDYTCSLKNKQGLNDIYLVFKGEPGKNLFSIDWIKFE